MGEFLTATELGAAVQRSEQTIKRWDAQGLLRTVLIGGRKMFRRSDVEKARALASEKRHRTKSNPALQSVQDRKSAAAGE